MAKWIKLAVIVLVILTGLFFINKYTFGFSVLPKNVTPSFTKKGVLQEVSSKNGGVVELAGETVNYSLNFPAKALMKAENINVKEIGSLKGLRPGWKLLAGIQVGPDSAMFSKPAVLTIDTKSTSQGLYAFSYSADGKEFHFVPATFKDGVATIPVHHFSGFGVLDLGNGKPASVQPSDMHLRYENSKRQIVQDAALDTGGIEENDANATKLYNLLRAWYQAKTKPGLQAAVASGTGVDSAVLEFEYFRAHCQEIPGGEEALATLINEGMDLSAKAIKAGIDLASKKCLADRDASQAGTMIRLMALAESDDFQGRVPGITDAEITDKVARCATFKLTVQSTITDNIDGSIYSETASGEGVLTTNDELILSGEGKITMTDMQSGDMNCTFNEVDTFKVEDVSLIFTGTKQAEMTIEILPGEADSYTCVSRDPEISLTVSGENTSPWWGSYANAHDDELPSFASDMFTMKDWEIVNKDGVYARKVYARTRYPSKLPWWLSGILRLIGGIRPLTDTTTWELIHMPR